MGQRIERKETAQVNGNIGYYIEYHRYDFMLNLRFPPIRCVPHSI